MLLCFIHIITLHHVPQIFILNFGKNLELFYGHHTKSIIKGIPWLKKDSVYTNFSIK